jgi:hypothetical protein
VTSRTLRLLLTALLVVSAALFAIGVAIERDSHPAEGSEAHAAVGPSVLLVAAADEHAGESAAQREAEEREAAEKRETTEASEEEHGERSPSKSESGEAAEGREGGHEEGGSGSSERAGGESAAHRENEANGERIFGIDTESTGLVVAAVVVSLALAIALWLSESVVVPLALAAFALLAAVFDVRESFHQIDESRTNLTVIAAVVAALHLAAVAGALLLARRSRVEPV